MKRSVIPAVLLLTCVCSFAEVSQLVVLESNIARYAEGELLPTDTVFELNDGQRIVVATNDGMITLDGPHRGIAAGEPPSEASALQTLRRFVGASSSRLSGLGGARGPEDAPSQSVSDTRPSPWFIHAELTGEQCYVDGRPTEIWRNDNDQDLRFELREISTDRTGTISWAANENEASWPAELPPRHGEIYLLREAGRLRSGTSIRVFSLEPGAADDPFTAAAWLAARGCTGQAEIALAALN